MSALAQKWAYSQKVGNAVAKNILAFLASHNFAGDNSCFKVKTIMAATEYEESSVRRALTLLHELKLIMKIPRFGELGQQLTNDYILNIPQSYKDKFFEDYHHHSPVDKLEGGGVRGTGGGCTTERGGVYHVHPLNNNINNNINKSFKSSCLTTEQKKHKPIQNPPPTKVDNAKKPEWAETKSKGTAFADVCKQSTSYDPALKKEKIFDPNSSAYQNFKKSTQRLRRNHADRSKDEHNEPSESTQLPSTTEVQPEISSKNDSGVQGAEIIARRYEGSPSRLRVPYWVLEARSAYTHFAQVGMAGSNGRECDERLE